jgi:hypothetical protein
MSGSVQHPGGLVPGFQLNEVVFTGPVISADQMREYGREALEAFRSDIESCIKPRGRHAGKASYLEGWAERYWRSQQAVERDRLRKGKARHRAHRDPLPGKPATK